MAKKFNWNRLARFEARDAHENNFSSRRGVFCYNDAPAMCVYNNNPYANFPKLRDEETALFREWLRSKGIPELAYATYPPAGPHAGYTCAMLIGAGEDRENEVVAELHRILDLSFGRMRNGTATANPPAEPNPAS